MAAELTEEGAWQSEEAFHYFDQSCWGDFAMGAAEKKRFRKKVADYGLQGFMSPGMGDVIMAQMMSPWAMPFSPEEMAAFMGECHGDMTNWDEGDPHSGAWTSTFEASSPEAEEVDEEEEEEEEVQETIAAPPGLEDFIVSPSSKSSAQKYSSLSPSWGLASDREEVEVLITGLPKALCAEPFLETMLEQAGLEDVVVSCSAGQGFGELRVLLLGQLAAERCVAHFNGCCWGRTEKSVSASILQAK